MSVLNLNNFKHRRFIIISIIILVVAALSIGSFLRLKFIERQREREQLELAKAKCQEEVSQMNEEQIIEKINTLALNTVEETKLMIKYLVCDLRLNPTEENYNKTKENILKMELTDESRRINIAGIEAMYPNLQSMRDFTTSFPALVATEEGEFICPQNKLSPQLLEACLSGGRKSVPTLITRGKCDAICEGKYSKNTKAYDEEIINFTKWFDEWTKEGDYSGLRQRYSWRLAVAYRFGGENDALKVCGNLPPIKEAQDDCISAVERLKKLKEEKSSCSNTFKELMALICRTR